MNEQCLNVKSLVSWTGIAGRLGGKHLAIFVFAMVSCLAVNGALKVVMIKSRVPTAL